MNASSSEGPIVVGLGELLWDCFAESRKPGGAPANVAFHAGQLGCRGVVCSRVGSDELGDELVAFLQQQGIPTEWVQRDEEHPTGTVTVRLGRDGQPSYVIHDDVAWDHIALDESLQNLMSKASAVCIGTLAQRSPTTRRSIHRALASVSPECLVVYDVNLRPPHVKRDWIEESLIASHIVKLNMEEVVELADLLATGTPDPVPFARMIQEQFGVEKVCVTQGRQGCLLIGPEDVLPIPGVTVEVADTVGAGDAFTAALICSRLQGWPLEKGAAFATHCGALVAGRPGAMPPLRDEFAALAAQYQ